MKGWLDKYPDGGEVNLNLPKHETPDTYKYGWSNVNADEGNFMMGAGAGNDKFGVNFMGMTPLSSEARKHWPGMLSGNVNYNVNDRLNLSVGTEYSKDSIPGVNLGLKYKFPDGGPIEVPYTNKGEYEQAQQMYSDSLLVNQMRAGEIPFARPDYLGAMDRLIEVNNEYPKGESPKTIPVYVPPAAKARPEAKLEPEVTQGIPTYYTDVEGNRKFVGYNIFRQGGPLSKLSNFTYNNWLDKL